MQEVPWPPANTGRARQVFVELDEDGNGLLSRDELCAGLVSFGLAKASPMASGSPKHALDASRARLSCYFVTISKEIVSELHSSMSTTSSQDTDRSGESEPEPRDTLPLNELFAAVDIDPRHADALTFEEFVVLMAIIALLRVKEVREPSGAGVHVAEDDLADFEAAADIVLDCFISFDADSDGLVSREEIAHVLAGHSTPTSMRRHSDDRDQMHDVVLRRFEEMDVDDSGNVRCVRCCHGADRNAPADCMQLPRVSPGDTAVGRRCRRARPRQRQPIVCRAVQEQLPVRLQEQLGGQRHKAQLSQPRPAYTPQPKTLESGVARDFRGSYIAAASPPELLVQHDAHLSDIKDLLIDVRRHVERRTHDHGLSERGTQQVSRAHDALAHASIDLRLRLAGVPQRYGLIVQPPGRVAVAVAANGIAAG